MSNSWVCAPPSTSISLRSPFCWLNTVVLYSRPHWVSNLTPNKLCEPAINELFKGMLMLPASTFFKMSSSSPWKPMFIWFSKSNSDCVLYWVPSSILSPILPLRFNWMRWSKSMPQAFLWRSGMRGLSVLFRRAPKEISAVPCGLISISLLPKIISNSSLSISSLGANARSASSSSS